MAAESRRARGSCQGKPGLLEEGQPKEARHGDDRGETWKPVAALNDHPPRGAWLPGAGGLCAHAILTDRRNPRRLWCGISAVGVFRTEDGGGSWQPRNQGVQITIEDKVHKDVGY